MKNIIVITAIFTLSAMVFSGCGKNESGDSLPDNITIGISDAISYPVSGSSKSANLGVDPLTGEGVDYPFVNNKYNYKAMEII